MTPDGLARTHDAAFAGHGWPAADFATYLFDTAVYVFGDEDCFAIIRRAGPEAEVLTLATHPRQQGQGRATAMLRNALATLAEEGVDEVFLDVAESNAAGLALYRSCGFATFARRPKYYRNNDTALCMKALLSPASP